MKPLMLFLDSWLLGGLTYPALTFVITAAIKSTLLVLGTWALTACLGQKPALMRLWAWRSCSIALLSVLLWGLVPLGMEKLRWSVEVPLKEVDITTIKQAQSVELLSKKATNTAPLITADARAPLLSYATEDVPSVLFARLRAPWMERIEQRTFHAWWSVALLLLAWRMFRSVCGHLWLHRRSEGVLNGTMHRLVRGLTSPVVTGWHKAQIWLPIVATQWPEAKLRAVCLHEMAHHARHDGAWQWLGYLTASVWWWNPLAWLALRQMTAEAELSADESALSQQIAATDYAQMLVEIAAGGDLSTPAAGVAMLGRSGLKSRVNALLRGVGQKSMFGRKTRFLLVLTSFAAVMAAGVELRLPDREKPDEPLNMSEKAMVKRALAIIGPQVEKLARVHVKLTESSTIQGMESTRPTVVEAWIDEVARQSRVEYRPRVTRWTKGAASWYIKDETRATNGKQGWGYEGGDMSEAIISKDQRYDFFSFWEAVSDARQLLDLLEEMEAKGHKRFNKARHVISENGGRMLIERQLDSGVRADLWEIDLEKRGLALFRERSPKSPAPYLREWRVLGWATLADGTPYPRSTKRHFNDNLSQAIVTLETTFLETISSVPPALLAPPEKGEPLYIAKDGVARHGEWLETRFVHAQTGKPVPEVKVFFEINNASRKELTSDMSGVLLIPLPKEKEIRLLCLWGTKPGFVMQRVVWQRYSDPLNLPEVYETKLFPAGKPIGGVVLDEEAKPVEGAQIVITHRGSAIRSDTFSDVHDHGNGGVQTDAEGKWAMRGFAEDLSGLGIRVEHPKYKRVAMSYENASGQSVESLRDGTSRIVLKSEGLK